MSQRLLPYRIDERPTREDLTARAGLPLFLETMRVAIPQEEYDNLSKIMGMSADVARRHVESAALLIAAGGDAIGDIDTLRADDGLCSLLGFMPSSATQLKSFLYGFHRDEQGNPLSVEQDRALSVRGKAQIRPESPGLVALRRLLQRASAAMQVISGHRRATLDADATLVESHKKEALPCYEGFRSYQPQMAWWAEAGVWIHDQFRDGNVNAEMGILDFAKAAFGALPRGITHRAFRGDSACYNAELITWLDDQDIDFAISADMGTSLAAAVKRLHDGDWKPYTSEGGPSASEERHCAEILDFQPEWSDKRRRKTGLRYIAIRVRSRQGELFEKDGYRYFAIITNLTCEPAHALRWHRKKAGTVEKGHAIQKNDLAGGVMPCARFGANAAWWRLNALVHNLLEVMKAQALPETMADLRPKALRFHLFAAAGRIVRHGRELVLRLTETCRVHRILIEARDLIVELAEQLSAAAAAAT
jgi:hypothetical protein